jgi:peptidoglycan/LPS O-acetylase OafA/YrhL
MSFPSPARRVAKITEFDGLRGLMALIVVASHVLAHSAMGAERLWRPFRFLTNGGLGVDVFVMLSGFVIFFLIDRGQENYGQFIWRRFWRLFPAYFVCLMLGVALSFRAVELLHRLPWQSPTLEHVSRNWQLSQNYFWSHLGWHLTMLHGLLPDEILPNSTGAFIEPAWSVSLEWQFYLIAPAVYFLIQRRWGLVTCLLGIWVCYYARRFFGDYGMNGRFVTYQLHGFLPLKAHYFFVGIASYYLHRAVSRSSLRIPALVLPATVLASLLFVEFPAVTLWIVVLGSHLTLHFGEKSWLADTVCALLNSRLAQAIGKISYSIYLLHMSVIYLGIFLLTQLRSDWTNTQFCLALSAFVVVGVGLGASLLYRWVEKPAMDFARRSAAPKPAIVSLATS